MSSKKSFKTSDKAGARQLSDRAVYDEHPPGMQDVIAEQDGVLLPARYLNNLVEQDHRNIKRRTRPMLEFKSFRRAQTILAGIKLIHMIRKGQFQYSAGEGLSPAEQFYLLAAVINRQRNFCQPAAVNATEPI